MGFLGPRKDHRKGSNRKLKASDRPTASQLRRGPKQHQIKPFAHQTFQKRSSGHGQQKPLNLFAQFDRKVARFEASSLIIFGHQERLFIGKSEHPNALGRLAHCLRSLDLPQMALDRASPDHNRHLQVAAISAETLGGFSRIPATPVAVVASSLYKGCSPDHYPCNPVLGLARNGDRRPVVGFPLGKVLLNCTLARPLLSFVLLPFCNKPLNFPLLHSRPLSPETSV